MDTVVSPAWSGLSHELTVMLRPAAWLPNHTLRQGGQRGGCQAGSSLGSSLIGGRSTWKLAGWAGPRAAACWRHTPALGRPSTNDSSPEYAGGAGGLGDAVWQGPHSQVVAVRGHCIGVEGLQGRVAGQAGGEGWVLHAGITT